MPLTLNIQIGGLCLFVEADRNGLEPDNKPGLFALMPQHGTHKPLLVYSGAHTNQKELELTRQEINIAGQIIPLRGLSTAPPQKRTLPTSIPRVSAFGGKVIDPRFTRGNLVPGLLTRIELDLGVELKACGSPIDLTVRIDGEDKSTKGIGLVSATIQAPNHEYLTIAGKRLYPIGGEINIGFHNVVNGDLFPPRQAHQAGDNVPHFQAYYPFVGLLNGPNPRATTNGPGVDPDPSIIPAGVCQPGSRDRGRYIDPFRCTLGGGCELDPTNC